MIDLEVRIVSRHRLVRAASLRLLGLAKRVSKFWWHTLVYRSPHLRPFGRCYGFNHSANPNPNHAKHDGNYRVNNRRRPVQCCINNLLYPKQLQRLRPRHTQFVQRFTYGVRNPDSRPEPSAHLRVKNYSSAERCAQRYPPGSGPRHFVPEVSWRHPPPLTWQNTEG